MVLLLHILNAAALQAGHVAVRTRKLLQQQAAILLAHQRVHEQGQQASSSPAELPTAHVASLRRVYHHTLTRWLDIYLNSQCARVAVPRAAFELAFRQRRTDPLVRAAVQALRALCNGSRASFAVRSLPVPTTAPRVMTGSASPAAATTRPRVQEMVRIGSLVPGWLHEQQHEPDSEPQRVAPADHAADESDGPAGTPRPVIDGI